MRLLKEMITALSALPLMRELNLHDSRGGTMLSAPDFKIIPRLLYHQLSPTTVKQKTAVKPNQTKTPNPK